MMSAKSNRGWKRNYGVLLAGGVVWAFLCEISVAKAQSIDAAHKLGESSRLIGAAEGRLIANTAHQSDQQGSGAQDCSHFVHQIYFEAGFEYPYASSFEIYAGDKHFARVRTAQPGDVIAWPGHVGIVLDPVKHSFFSLVSTGMEAQDYQGAYWKSRGRPRIYRFKVGSDRILNAATTTASPKVSDSLRQDGPNAAVEVRAPAESSNGNRPPKEVSERKAVLYGPPAPPELSGNPRSVVIADGNQPPTREEVAEGISELNDVWGDVPRNDDPLKRQIPIVIVEQFSVEKVVIKRNHGWARVHIDSRVSISAGQTLVKHSIAKARWELRRTESGWEAVSPQDRSYVAHDVAVKNLAAQLARLTETEGAAAHQEAVLQEESQLANLLNVLLQKK
jgi:hypothetical protein